MCSGCLCVSCLISLVGSVVVMHKGAIDDASLAVTVQVCVVDAATVVTKKQLIHLLSLDTAEGHVCRLMGKNPDQISQNDVNGVMSARPRAGNAVHGSAKLVPEALAVFYHISVQFGHSLLRQCA